MKKSQELELDEKTAKLLNRICDERCRLYNEYSDVPCLIKYLHFQEMRKLEDDVFEILGIDLPEFIYSKYRKY